MVLRKDGASAAGKSGPKDKTPAIRLVRARFMEWYYLRTYSDYSKWTIPPFF